LQIAADCKDQADHGGVFFYRGSKIIFHVPPGDYQAVTPAHRAGILKSQGKFVFGNYVQAPGVAKDTVFQRHPPLCGGDII